MFIGALGAQEPLIGAGGGREAGDTTVSQNLIDLAKDTDYLVHEVIDPQWARPWSPRSRPK